MKRLVFAILLICCSTVALAGSESYVRFRRDPGFMQTGRLQFCQWVNPAAADTDAVSAGVLLDSCAAGTHTFTDAEIANFTSTEDGYARTISVDINSRTGVDNDIKGATVTVYGTNILNETVSEAFTITNNTANSQQGAIAFRSLTYYTYGAMDDDSVGVSIGIGEKLGLWNTLPTDTMILAWNGTSADAAAVFTIDVDEIEKNVVDFDTDPTGTSDCGVLYWIPPFNITSTSFSYPGGSGKY